MTAESAPAGRRVAHVGRAVPAAVLILLGVVCLTVMPVAVWGRNLLLNTDRYVATLAPVAADPGVQDAVIQIVDDQVSAHLDLTAVIGQVLPPRAAGALGGVLQGAVTSLVDRVTTDFVRSDTFQRIWVSVNRRAHDQVRHLLLGTSAPGGAVRIDDSGRVLLDLSQVVQQVKDRLVAAGIGVAAKVPAAGPVLEIADLHGLATARKATRALNTTADWLPWLGLALVAGGIAAARRRRRAVIVSALGVGAGTVLVGAALLVGRHVYLDAVPPDALPRGTAAYLFDTLVRFLRLGLRALLLLALLIAFGAWVSGPGATRFRSAFGAGTRSVARRLPIGGAHRFVVDHTAAVRLGIIGLGGVSLLLMSAPSSSVVVGLVAITVLLLALVEVLRRSAASGDPA